MCVACVDVLQCVAVCCSVLQCVVVVACHRLSFLAPALCCNVLRVLRVLRVLMCHSLSQYVAVRCGVLQCVGCAGTELMLPVFVHLFSAFLIPRVRVCVCDSACACVTVRECV